MNLHEIIILESIICYIAINIASMLIAYNEKKLNIYTFAISLVMPFIMIIFCISKTKEIICIILQTVYVKTKPKKG